MKTLTLNIGTSTFMKKSPLTISDSYSNSSENLNDNYVPLNKYLNDTNELLDQIKSLVDLKVEDIINKTPNEWS